MDVKFKKVADKDAVITSRSHRNISGMQEENRGRKKRRTRGHVLQCIRLQSLRCKVTRRKSRVILPGLRGLTHSICAGVSRYFLNIRRHSGARRRHFPVAVNSVLLLIVRHSRYRSPSSPGNGILAARPTSDLSPMTRSCVRRRWYMQRTPDVSIRSFFNYWQTLFLSCTICKFQTASLCIVCSKIHKFEIPCRSERSRIVIADTLCVSKILEK